MVVTFAPADLAPPHGRSRDRHLAGLTIAPLSESQWLVTFEYCPHPDHELTWTAFGETAH